MAQHIDDRHRQVVPRWRPFRIAADLGHLEPTPPHERKRVIVPAPGELEELTRDWKTYRSPVHAADLIDAALVTGRLEVGADAAEFLLQCDVSDLSRAMARAVLFPGTPSRPPEPPDLSRNERYRRIAVARRYLHRTPRDPIRWVDLAREYSIVGQNGPAEKALHLALALAPEARFVLRAAARFFLHARRPDEAHRLLRRAGRTSEDPWLMAAEIVASVATEKRSRWLKKAIRAVESGRFEARDISELAGVLGTVEYEAGNRRKTRRLFERALVDPTENTVAQAGWLARHMSSFLLPRDRLQVPRAFEARAWESCLSADYKAAVDLAWMWLRDEPFATRPALFGSWVATTALGDHTTAAAFADAALLASPDDPRLIAQLAFCHAYQDDLERAEQLLLELPTAIAHHPTIASKLHWDVLQAADRGLIAFRRGRIEDGRREYERAIRLATEHEERQLAATALLYYAREEARASPSTAATTLAEARRALDAYPSVIRPLYEQLLRLPIRRSAGAKEPQ